MRAPLFAIVALASVAVMAQDFNPSDVERLRSEVATLTEQLAIARAQRADCESTLGPVEAQFRQRESADKWAGLKADMEKARPGFSCDPRTLVCTKKPEEREAPEKKSGGL
jgi:hypothetical protein